MRLSYSWLSHYVDLSGISPQELAEKMTTAGFEVASVEPMASGTGLVIGEVIECSDIEGTHLHDTLVRVGAGESDVYKIVCGAPNCRKGLKVIAALPGAKLPGGTITARPLHGHESNGMLCALFELGVDQKYLTQAQIDGIEELPEDAPVGETEVLKYLGYEDTILDVELTSNRSDCSSMWNMAKEVGAIVHRTVKWPECEGAGDCGEEGSFRVATKTPLCAKFSGKVVNSVKVGPSPKWMVQYLHAAGMNSINNVVDISNFVMLETGQPLHFYDLSKLKGREITVVDDVETTITALDGLDMQIKPGDLLITTGGEPTGIAGVMGGEESMIDENTKGIFIEAAHFDYASIRRTSIRLNLMTEAAARFSKGMEPLSIQKAIDRSVQLLKEYAGAEGFEKTVTAGDETYTPRTVVETLEHCNYLLGTHYEMNEVVDVLTALDFKPEVNGDAITCHIPSYRTDIAVQADIDEEIIRLLGYDSLDSTLPNMETTVGKRTAVQSMRHTTEDAMVMSNLHQIITYSLVGQEYVDNGFLPCGEPIALAMPMSEARKYVRTSLINSVLECVKYNEAHSNSDFGVFEMSAVYGQNGVRQERLAIALDGSLMSDKLRKHDIQGDFYAMKGILEAWLKKLGFSGGRVQVKENTTDVEHFHPYRSAELWLDREKIGVFGELHPSYAAKFDLKKTTYAEIILDRLFASKGTRLRFVPLDKYPSISRDIAVVCAQDVKAEDLMNVIRRTGKKLVRSTEIFDVYQGEHVEAGKKSVALRIVYQSDEHTLKEEEVTAVHSEILKQLDAQLDARQRA